MRDRDPIRSARRNARREQREEQGTAVLPCVQCTHEHHVVGRNHDECFTETLCEKHHREQHELLLRAGVSLRHEGNVTLRVATILRALAVHNRSEAEAFERWADLLDISETGT